DAVAASLSTAGDTRTVAQLRADALSDTLLGRDTGATRRFEGIRPTVVVTVPALSLLGYSHEPAELEGFGPIDPDTARVLAAEAPELRRLLTDPHTGIRLSLGRERYRPTADLRLWLRLRDRTCLLPGCPCPARAADVDHR